MKDPSLRHSLRRLPSSVAVLGLLRADPKPPGAELEPPGTEPLPMGCLPRDSEGPGFAVPDWGRLSDAPGIRIPRLGSPPIYRTANLPSSRVGKDASTAVLRC